MDLKIIIMKLIPPYLGFIILKKYTGHGENLLGKAAKKLKVVKL